MKPRACGAVNPPQHTASVLTPHQTRSVQCMQALADTAALADPRERARAAHALIDEYQEGINELSRIRREAIEVLLSDEGMTQTQVADLLGMSRSRISQLLSANVRPERAFLGT